MPTSPTYILYGTTNLQQGTSVGNFQAAINQVQHRDPDGAVQNEDRRPNLCQHFEKIQAPSQIRDSLRPPRDVEIELAIATCRRSRSRIIYQPHIMSYEPMNPQFFEADKEMVEQLRQELKKLQQQPDITLNITPLAAWSLIVQIQVAGRHPENNNWMYEQVRQFADQIQTALQLSDWMTDYTNKGWNPELDVPSNLTNKHANQNHNLQTDTKPRELREQAFGGDH